MAKKVKQIGKNTLIVLIGLLIILMIYMLYKMYGNKIVELIRLLEHGNQDELTAYLTAQKGFGGYFMLWFISVLQVVSIFFPGMVIQIAGALIYGWWKSFLICWFGFVSGNAIVFIIARLFGKSVQVAFHKDKEENWLTSKINQGNGVFVVAIACMVPGIPNGIIPYLASQTKLTTKDFVVAVAGSCWIQILLNCIAGHFIAQGEYIYTVIAFVIEILLVIIVAKKKDILLKNTEKTA